MVKLQFDWESAGNRFEALVNRFVKWAFSFRGGITLVCLGGLLCLPLTGREYLVTIVITAMILAIFAASWDLLAGFAGQTSFGHAAFFGISGYFTAALVKFYGVHWFVAIFIGAGCAVIFSLLIGIPCLRLKGPYLALGTLAFALILYNLFLTGDWLGGTEGISALPNIGDVFVVFYIVAAFMVASLIIMRAIVDSNLGTILKAIRDDEVGADATGINTTVYKLIAFMVSGLFAGIAGALFVLDTTAVNPALFQPLYSFYAIVMASIGGIATIYGSIVGAFLFRLTGELLRPLAAASLLIFATILILIIRFAEEGVMNPVLGHVQDLWDKIRGR
ncbi:MAG: branched-chain amino acid ABC transporter permease [Candidatus Thorarchaeota archaeon]|nr:MAG: branched-chain amino acid ABC transporter permease [Candidatus Thorarchaeota archaeon]